MSVHKNLYVCFGFATCYFLEVILYHMFHYPFG